MAKGLDSANSFVWLSGGRQEHCSGEFVEYLPSRRRQREHYQVADPIYECQDFIYRCAGKPLTKEATQDGELLNFIGGYLRKINPNALLNRFDTNLSEISSLLSNETGEALILCDDMRQADYDHLVSRGFLACRVVAPKEACVERRRKRGDVTLGSTEHPTERGIDRIVPDLTFDNSGSPR